MKPNNAVARFLPALLIVLLSAITFVGCKKQETASTPESDRTPSAPNSASIELLFAYGSEKQAWIEAVTHTFNEARHPDASGKIIHVTAKPMGSGECIDALLDGSVQAQIASPASGVFVELGNARSKVKSNRDLLDVKGNLVVSPVVIAMWKPMAEAIGWGTKPVGWAEILALAKDPKGWGTYGHPEWGAFKFGHTHPEFSNSGLISVLAEVYAAAGKARGLTDEDIAKPQVGTFLDDIEGAIVHYGSSTGFFGSKMIEGGPSYLSAAVLYESVVVDAYSKNPQLPLVAIYPKEGTFWSDHPVGIVNREWVSPEHTEAAKTYIDYLLAKPQQEKATSFGFRPGDPSIAFTAPIDAAHGVDPKEPKTVLEVPGAARMDGVVKLWHQHKKHANIVLVFDTSGSMNADQKMVNARLGAQQLVSLLDDEDTLSLLPFSTEFHWVAQSIPLKTGRDSLNKTIGAFYADGNTMLYNTIDTAYQYLTDHPQPAKISAVVVLTDGADSQRGMRLDDLISKLHSQRETSTIRVFTIGYGSDADMNVLKRIADETRALAQPGKPATIKKVFQDIATFF